MKLKGQEVHREESRIEARELMRRHVAFGAILIATVAACVWLAFALGDTGDGIFTTIFAIGIGAWIGSIRIRLSHLRRYQAESDEPRRIVAPSVTALFVERVRKIRRG